MEKTIKFPVDEDGVGKRIDVFLASRLPDISRQKIKKAISLNLVSVRKQDGCLLEKVKPSFVLDWGMIVEVDEKLLIEDKKEIPICKDADLEILYEDEEILVINKPVGISVHPGAGNKDEITIVSLLLGYVGKDLLAVGDEKRPGIVHRLDKDTSGILLIAKTERMHRKLSRMFAKRKIQKEYLTLVWGHIQLDEDRISLPIARDKFRWGLYRVSYEEDAKDAITEYKVLQRCKDNTSVVLVSLITGRTHQIRIHMAYLGYPVVGDHKYGRRKEDPFGRLCLHAYRMRFVHPIKNSVLEIKTELPQFVKNYGVLAV